MLNLRQKMKWTLFGVLSLLIWLIAGVFNFQNYLSVQSSLIESMNRITELTRDVWAPSWQGPYTGNDGIRESERIELMYENSVSFVFFDRQMNPYQVASSSDKAFENSAYIQEVTEEAKEVVRTHRPGSFDASLMPWQTFAWSYLDAQVVMVVETESIRADLVQTALVSIVIGALFELILYAICRRAADMMIKPIEETFEKQKQFIADASHELKTPVAVILANAEAMEKDPDVKWLHNIVDESNRMNGLITDLLDLTRNEQREIVMEPVDLSRLVARQCLSQEALMFEHHILLEEDIEKNRMVSGSASMLEQVIAILLDNATAHSTGKIAVRLYGRGKDVVLDVSNTGEPIPEEAREKIFERFYRADESRNRKSDRYGLGLAIAKSIVDRHGGKIEVFCKDGLTTFQVVLRSL